MTTEAIRKFINDHAPAAAGLAGLFAALEARASSAALEPRLATRIDELLEALGSPGLLDHVTPTDAGMFVPELRHTLGANAALLDARSRGLSWAYEDPQLLQAVGDFSRMHAQGLIHNVIPALEGVAARFDTPGAAFLDVGVGVGGLAIALAQHWRHLRIVGIDVWRPALALARTNVDNARLRERIELRDQGVETIADEAAFDLAWMPIPFISEQVIPEATARLYRALKPGGWVVFNFANFGAMDPRSGAMWRLRTTTWGGPLWTLPQVETLLHEQRFASVTTLPTPPGSPVALVVGRRPA
jgi:ubiquinone/menaquinone biosynthesis C-methylase UbiE